MGLEGEGSGGRGGGKCVERGREVGIGYPPVHPLSVTSESMRTKYWLTACSSLPRKKCGYVN